MKSATVIDTGEWFLRYRVELYGRTSAEYREGKKDNQLAFTERGARRIARRWCRRPRETTVIATYPQEKTNG